jgi:hypothetical protein
LNAEILWLLLGNTHLETRLPLYLTGCEVGEITQIQLSIEMCRISDRSGIPLKKLVTFGKSRSWF